MSFFILIIPLFIIGVIVMAVLGHKAEKERRDRLRRYCVQREWNFSPERLRIERDYPDIGVLRQGSNRYAYNVIRGEWSGHGLIAFDYHYETESRDSDGDRTTHHHYFSVLMLQPDFPLQALTIRPEGIFDKMKAAFGWDDIDFESAEFSRRFHVKADDRRWAYDVLNPQTIEFLLSIEKRAMQMAHGVLALHHENTLEPTRIESMAKVGSRILGGIPNFARDERGV